MKHVKLFEEVDRAYSWDELSDEAKETAIDNDREINIYDNDWHEGVISDATEDLFADGVEDVEILYTGFHSQGDGASFTGKIYDPKKWLKAIGMENVPPEVRDLIYARIDRGSSRYYHEMTVGLIFQFETDDSVLFTYPFGPEVPMEFNLVKLQEEIEKKGEKWLRSTCQKIYSDLEKEYEALTSDDAVEDTLIANDYKFDEDGNII
jgi:hypothetical protein